ncbi:MAG: O-antigen ligase family protein [Candidatus Edwardsbacteria bacterium]|nr:O-antigen ligase family protein [Candidatus Edwardsbacteria bacterium]
MDDRSQLQQTLDLAIAAGGSIVSFFGIKQLVAPDFMDPGYLSPGKMHIYSTIGNANYLAFFLLYSFVITLGLFKRNCHKMVRYMLILGMFLQGLCFLATFSRTAYAVAAILGIAAAIRGIDKSILLDRIGKKRILVASICLAGLSIIVFGMVRARDMLDGHTLRGRYLIWSATANMIKDHPLKGVGIGQYQINYIPYQAALFGTGKYTKYESNASFALHAHSEPLHVWAETGVAGLAAFLFILGLGLREGSRYEKEDRRIWHWYGVMGLSLAGLFNNFLHTIPLATAFWTSLGMIMPKPVILNKPLASSLRTLMVSGFLLGSLFLAVNLYTTGMSNYYERQGDLCGEQKYYADAALNMGKAIRLYPNNGFAREKYALSLYLAGRVAEAEAQLDTAKHYSGDIGITYLKAEMLAYRRSDEAAISLYRYIASAFPTHITPHLALGQLLLRQGKYQMAEQEFRKILEIRPSTHNLKMDWRKAAAQRAIARFFLSHGP